jgi:arylsulfatase A-like enzyme
MYEGGLRQACLVRWPGHVPAGKVSDEPWAFWDFLPTCADLLGVKLPAPVKTDGASALPLFVGGPAPKRTCFYWELHEQGAIQAVRFGDWKAVKNGPGAAIELYDLKADPGETRNLAAKNPELVERGAQLLASEHTDNPDWPMKDPPRKKKAAVKKGKG